MAQGIQKHSNLYKAIRLDHDNVRELGEEFLRASVHDRARIVNTIVRELSIHNVAEEIALYPHYVKYLGGEAGWALYVKSKKDHEQTRKYLLNVADLCFDRPPESLNAKVAELISAFNQHAVDEETDIIPRFEQAVGKPELLEEFKNHFLNVRKIAPSRPHPVDPNDAALEIVALLSFAVIDKMSDRERVFAPLSRAHTDEY